ncbi:MAG: DUF3786 domain-containing protein [Spirochaetota bacterium]|nr:DUF3786 domain-containing protein [Spirochaetota bacterium]
MGHEHLPDHFIIDDNLWNELKNSQHQIICHNCEISYCLKGRFYTIPVLNENYGVYPWEEKVYRLSDKMIEVTRQEIELSLFLLHYLLGTTDIQLTGEMVSGKDLKGGEMFFRGPHTLPVRKIIEKYGKDPAGLIQAGENLGGERLDLGDASIGLRIAPKIPITYILWAEDDEFSANVNILFDPTIQNFLPLDIIFGITVFVYNRLV